MTIEGRPRSRSFSSTPTFSADLAKLKSSLSTSSSPPIVHSYTEAIALASTFDVLGNNSALTPKLKLVTEGDWIELFDKSGAVTVVSGEDTNNDNVDVNMEKFLRYCFDIAYKMPPSPNNRVLRESVKAGGSAAGTAAVPSLAI